MKSTSISIIGCCFTRDIFNVEHGKKYEVKSYIQRHNPFLILQSSDENYLIDEIDVNLLKYADFTHNFNRRMILSLINNNAKNLLLSRKGDWIVIDTHYAYGTLMRLSYPSGQSIYFQSGYALYAEELLRKIPKFASCSIEKLDATINMDYFVDDFCDFLKSNWGTKIIIINETPAKSVMFGDGDIEPLISPVTPWDSLHCLHMCEILKQKLNCHFIDIPFITLSRDSDESHVHYTHLIMEYLKNAIDLITSRNYNLDLLRIQYCCKLEDIYYGRNIAEYEAISLSKKLIQRHENFDTILNLANKLINLGNNLGYAFKGIICLLGLGVRKDATKAMNLLEMSNCKRVEWVISYYLDEFYKQNTAQTN